MLLKAQNIFNGGAAEFVNALIVVTDNTQVFAFFRQQADKAILRVVGILVFVDHQIPEAVLIFLQNIRLGFKQFHRAYQQIVKIHGVGILQSLLIQAIAIGYLFQAKIVAGLNGKFLRRQKIVLCAADLTENGLVTHHTLLDAQRLHALLHQAAAVVRIVDGEMRGIAECTAILTQNTGAEGVKGAGNDLSAFVTEHGFQTILQLTGSLVGKGDGKNAPCRAGVNRTQRVQSAVRRKRSVRIMTQGVERLLR